MNIRGKLIVGNLVIVIIMALASYLSLDSVRRLRELFNTVHSETVPSIEALENLRFSGLRIVSSVSEFGLIHSQEQGSRPGEKTSAKEQSVEEKLLIKEGITGYDEALIEYASITNTTCEEDAGHLAPITAKGALLKARGLRITELTQAGVKGKRILDAKEDFEAAEKDFLAAINSAIAHHRADLADRKQKVEAEAADAIGEIALFGLLGVGVALLIGFILSHDISSRLLHLKEAAVRIEGGDLRPRLNTEAKDELGQLTRTFNSMGESLFKATSRLNGVLQNMADLLAVTDSEGAVLLVNRQFVETLGYAPEEIYKKNAAVLFHGKEIPLPAEGRPPEFVGNAETLLLAKDGRLIPALVSTSGLTDEDGKFQGFIAVMRDISSRKETERRMAQAEKIAVVGQLATGIAHEINNPIGIILGFAQSIVKRTEENDPLAAPLRTIEREARRCKEFVQGVLNFSRSSTDELRKEVAVNFSVESAMPLILAQCKARGIELVLKLADGLKPVNLYPSVIQQAIINLCSNAMDAMPDGGTLTISTFAREVDGRPHAAVQISDTGHGMTKEVQSRMFEPFFTTKPVGKGTGLGLLITSEGVRRHDGHIEVDSSPGHGSAFTIFLPTARKPPGGE